MSIGPYQERRDTAAAWTAANPVLLSGLKGFETDTGKWKIGDGTTAWTALPYFDSAAVVDTTAPFTTGGWNITTSDRDVSAMLRDFGESALSYFGIDRTGATDSAQGFQNAVDHALYIAGLPRLAVPSGSYAMSKTLHIGYGDVLTGFDFVGVKRPYGGNFPGARFFPTFANAPAIAVQGARATRIKRIGLFGPNAAYYEANFDTFDPDVFYDPAFWTSGVPVSSPNMDSQHAPFAGIAIDPYSGSGPTDAYPPVAYPAPLPQGQYGRAHSSEVDVDDVVIRGFIVGVVLKPSADSNNGDFVRLRRSELSFNKYGFSAGNTQARMVKIEDSQILNSYTGVTTSTHGHKTGRIMRVENTAFDGCALAARVDDTTVNGPLTFANCYAERLGVLAALAAGAAGFKSPVVFDNCHWQFGHEESEYFPGQSVYADGAVTLVFNGGTLSGYGEFAAIAGPDCIFNGTTLQPRTTSVDPFIQHAIRQTLGGVMIGSSIGRVAPAVDVHRCRGGFTQTATLDQTALIEGADEKRQYVPYYTKGLSFSRFPGGSADRHVALSRSRSRVSTLDKSIFTLTPTNNTLAGTVSVSEGGNEYGLSLGDVLVDRQTAVPYVITALTRPDPSAIVLTAMTGYRVVGGVPALLPASAYNPVGQFDWFNMNCFAQSLPLIGDYTSGSPVIANVRRRDGGAIVPALTALFVVNDYLLASGGFEGYDTSGLDAVVLPFPARILAVNDALKTITINSNAGATGTFAVGNLGWRS